MRTPALPPGRFVRIGDLGTVVVRDAGPRDAELTVLLLHGWTATADLNWFRCYGPLAERYRVVAFDHRGHGSGLRTAKRFQLEDCADDAAEVIAELGVERVVAAGYSMGGPIAQLLWRRHRDLVRGLVLCATAPVFSTRPAERLSFLGASGLAALARIAPEQARTWLTDQLYLQRRSRDWEPWAMQEASSHDWRMLLEAGTAIGSFDSTGWIGDVDVPVSLIVTMRDRVVSRRRQTMLFDLLDAPEVARLDADHDAAVEHGPEFVDALLRSIGSVEERSR
ncbi:alpha/beta fold hydrolase [Ilumatobacter sp.]|uniref:alpha/beta fold hydrolase n=1 Tax=Ilumatobacter sp. TaxID=1967498 RepID=UPI003B519AE8